LRPARGRRNLEVWTDAVATRVVFEGERAAGLEYRRGGEVAQIRARKEIILSAGPLQSPQLLELSGIGRPEILSKHGIGIAHALPGVGENLFGSSERAAHLRMQRTDHNQ
jgi:choline dehydrogenase-like flavoprotein